MPLMRANSHNRIAAAREIAQDESAKRFAIWQSSRRKWLVTFKQHGIGEIVVEIFTHDAECALTLILGHIGSRKVLIPRQWTYSTGDSLVQVSFRLGQHATLDFQVKQQLM